MKNLPKVRAVVDALKNRTDISVSVEKSAWVVRIPKCSGRECEVTIPIDWCFEWFASLKENGNEFWRDSMEHYGASDDRLDAEMAGAILSYVDRVVQSDLTEPVSMGDEESNHPSEAKS